MTDLDVMLELIADELRVVADEEVATVLAGESPPKNRERAGLLAFLGRVATIRAERHAALEARWNGLIEDGFEDRLRAVAAG